MPLRRSVPLRGTEGTGRRHEEHVCRSALPRWDGLPGEVGLVVGLTNAAEKVVSRIEARWSTLKLTIVRSSPDAAGAGLPK